MEILFEDFKNLDIRIGKISAVEEIPNSKNLYKLEVDFGAEKRTAVAGIKKHYSLQALMDKRFAFILNLERKKLMGIESECMLLAADDGVNVAPLKPDKDVIEGSKVR